jgi:hypothetical protein
MFEFFWMRLGLIYSAPSRFIRMMFMNWYLVITVPAIAVLAIVLKNNQALIGNILTFVQEKASMLLNVAGQCFNLSDLRYLWVCLSG